MRTVGMRRLFAVSAVAAGIALTGCENSVEPPAGSAAGGDAQEQRAAGEPSAGETAGGETAGGETPAQEPDTASGEGAATGAADGGAGGAATEGTVSDEMMDRVESQFPALSGLVPREQMRAVVEQVCGTVRSGDMGAARQEMQSRFGVDPSTAQQVVSFLERDVCKA